MPTINHYCISREGDSGTCSSMGLSNRQSTTAKESTQLCPIFHPITQTCAPQLPNSFLH